MRVYRIAMCGILTSAFLWAGPASAGWVIEQVVGGGDEGVRQHLMLQSNRMKTLMLGAHGEPFTAFILDLNTDTITQVDYKRRHYFTTTVQEFTQMVQGIQRAMSDLMVEVMNKMQEAMKEVPPEQREMVEQMMGGRMPESRPTAEDCREPKVEWRGTGQRATIAGYPAVGYDLLIDGKPESELWLAKDITAWREVDPLKLERFATEMAKLAPRCGPAHVRYGFLPDEPVWKLAGEGFPVRIVRRNGGGTVEVVKAEARTVPAEEFQPPAGFALQTLREVMGE